MLPLLVMELGDLIHWRSVSLSELCDYKLNLFQGNDIFKCWITFFSLSTVLVALAVSLNWLPLLAHALEWHISEREGEQWITWLTPLTLSVASSAWMNKWGQCRTDPLCQKQGRKWWPSWRAVLQCFSEWIKMLIWHGLFSLPFSMFRLTSSKGGLETRTCVGTICDELYKHKIARSNHATGYLWSTGLVH